MAEIRINSTGGLKLYDADDSHYAQIVAGTITSNTDVMTLGHAAVVMGTKLDMNGSNLVLDADADTYLDTGTDDTIKFYVSGAHDLTIGANAINVLSGTTLTIDSGATITNSGTANGFGSSDPSSADGDSLGTASAEWSDLYLADGGIVYFGNDQEITLTHVADTGLNLKHAATADDKYPTFTLQTGDTDIAADDKLGVINFQAPDEGTGTDAILVAASIEAVAEGNFAADSNATSLVFRTGASEAAGQKMKITSAGDVQIGTSGDDTGAKMSVSTNDSGATCNAAADEFCVETNGAAGISILSFNNTTGSLFMGDGQDDDVAGIYYDHNNHEMHIRAQALDMMVMDGANCYVTSATTNQDIFLVHQTGASYGNNLVKLTSYETGNGYNFIACQSNVDSSADNEFKFKGDGSVAADGSYSSSGADYAEFFESKTGNAITKGTTVVLDGDKVRASTDSDATSTIIGVARPKTFSRNVGVVGNSAWSRWKDKYLKNDFGEYEMEEYTITEWTFREGTDDKYKERKRPSDDHDTTENFTIGFATDQIPGDITPPANKTVKTEDSDGNKLKRKKLNPSWDKTKTYKGREDRDEWVIVGLLGQVQITKGQKTGDRWIKMRDISDTVEEWYIR